MALRQLMLRRSITLAEEALRELQESGTSLDAREAELEAAIAEVTTDEERSATEEMVAAFEADRSANQAAIAEAQATLDTLRAQLAELEKNTPPDPAQGRGEHIEEGSHMITRNNINIRALPMSQRCWEAVYSMEARRAIVEQPEVREFLDRIRSFQGRTVSGADLLVPTVLLELISENQYRYSKLMSRVHVVPMEGNATQPVSGTVPEAVWTDCCAAINELQFSFGALPMSCHKVAGFIPLCNAQLEDSSINLAGTMVEVISMSIGLAKDKAILYGTGNGMPLGIVTRLAQQSQPESYPSTALEWTDLHSTHIVKIDGDSLTGAAFWAALNNAAGEAYSTYARGTKFWAMSTKTKTYLESKAITTTASGEWVALIGGVLPIVSGDIDVLEFIPEGDIVGGFGDLYLWGQRTGMQIVTDNMGFTNRVKDQTVFLGRERADGAPVIADAFVAINVKNTDVTTSMTFPTNSANDCRLQSLTVGALSLSPTFAAGTVTYTASAANNVSSVAVTGTPEQADAQVTVTVTSGSTTKNVVNGKDAALAVGANVIAVTVKKGNGVRVYRVTVTRASS